MPKTSCSTLWRNPGYGRKSIRYVSPLSTSTSTATRGKDRTTGSRPCCYTKAMLGGNGSMPSSAAKASTSRSSRTTSSARWQRRSTTPNRPGTTQLGTGKSNRCGFLCLNNRNTSLIIPPTFLLHALPLPLSPLLPRCPPTLLSVPFSVNRCCCPTVAALPLLFHCCCLLYRFVPMHRRCPYRSVLSHRRYFL